MLVLLSFGLVLVATVLLVLGLLSDSGLTLIYVSIASSALAGVVLIVAVRAGKPKASAPEAPTPLGDAEVADAAEIDRMRTPDAATEDASTDSDIDAIAADDGELVAEEGAGQWADAAPAWDGDGDGDVVDDVEFDFPIADYDDLTVGEIMPLLPQLYSDELDIVEEREIGGKDRVTIIKKIAELRETGTEADAVDDVPAAELEPEEVIEDIPAPAAVTPNIADDDDDDDFDDDDDDWFPIEDYDSLTVAQILPLIPQLEDDELDDVRAREAAGSARVTILKAIDDRIDPGAVAAPAPAPAPKPAPKRVAKKKKAAAKRTAVKRRSTKRATPQKTAAKKRTAKKSTAKKTATKKRTAKKVAAKKTAAKKRTAKKTAAKKRTAKKR